MKNIHYQYLTGEEKQEICKIFPLVIPEMVETADLEKHCLQSQHNLASPPLFLHKLLLETWLSLF